MFNPFALLTSKLVTAVGNAGDKLFTSDEERLAARNEREEILHKFKTEQLKRKTDLAALQVQANIAASNPNSRFTYRDAAGWICAITLGFEALTLLISRVSIWVGLPPLDLGQEFTPFHTLMGMLLGGIGIVRTVEKFGGVAKGQVVPAVSLAKNLLAKVRG